MVKVPIHQVVAASSKNENKAEYEVGIWRHYGNNYGE
jgi:hypothetical protein